MRRNLHSRRIKRGTTQFQIPDLSTAGHGPAFRRTQQTDEIEGEIFYFSLDRHIGENSELFGRSKRQAVGSQM